jgi:hypothetical protein
MAPLPVLSERPAGKVGETEYTTGEVPPVAVTGVKEVATELAVRISVAITRVVDSSVEITKANVFALVAPLTSVAVTV